MVLSPRVQPRLWPCHTGSPRHRGFPSGDPDEQEVGTEEVFFFSPKLMGFAPGSTHRVAGCKQAAPIGKNNHGWMQPPAPAPIHQNPSVSHEKPDLRPWELPGASPISSHPKSQIPSRPGGAVWGGTKQRKPEPEAGGGAESRGNPAEPQPDLPHASFMRGAGRRAQ